MKKYGVVIIGTGRIAAVHAASVHRSPVLELRGFVNGVDPGGLPGTWGVPCFSELQHAVDAVAPDALIIASPTATHPCFIAQAVKLGLPALCEKPLAANRQAATEIYETAGAAAVPIILGFHRRFDPHRRDLAARLAAGEIGKIEHILQLSRDPELPSMEVMRHQGGIVSDMVVHDLDELLWLIGSPPQTVHARLGRNIEPALAEIGDHDTASLQLEWQSGIVAHISVTRRCIYGFEQRLEVFGSQGRLMCADPLVRCVSADTAAGALLPRRHAGFAERYRDAYQAEVDHLGDLIRGRGTPLCTLDDGLRALDLVEQVLKAAARS